MSCVQGLVLTQKLEDYAVRNAYPPAQPSFLRTLLQNLLRAELQRSTEHRQTSSRKMWQGMSRITTWVRNPWAAETKCWRITLFPLSCSLIFTFMTSSKEITNYIKSLLLQSWNFPVVQKNLSYSPKTLQWFIHEPFPSFPACRSYQLRYVISVTRHQPTRSPVFRELGHPHLLSQHRLQQPTHTAPAPRQQSCCQGRMAARAWNGARDKVVLSLSI